MLGRRRTSGREPANFPWHWHRRCRVARVSFLACRELGMRGSTGQGVFVGEGEQANAQLQVKRTTGRERTGNGKPPRRAARALNEWRRPNARVVARVAWPSFARWRLGSTPRSSRHVCTRQFPICTRLLYLFYNILI